MNRFQSDGKSWVVCIDMCCFKQQGIYWEHRWFSWTSYFQIKSLQLDDIYWVEPIAKCRLEIWAREAQKTISWGRRCRDLQEGRSNFLLRQGETSTYQDNWRFKIKICLVQQPKKLSQIMWLPASYYQIYWTIYISRTWNYSQ